MRYNFYNFYFFFEYMHIHVCLSDNLYQNQHHSRFVCDYYNQQNWK